MLKFDEVIKEAYNIKTYLVENALPIMNQYFPNFECNVEEPTKGWVESFIERVDLKKKGETLEHDRSEVGTTGSVRLWFEVIEKVLPEIKWAKPGCIINFDETMLNISQKG